MQIREQLIRKALLALEEAVEQALNGPVAPSFALRFALAYLYMCGRAQDGARERWMHDAFWRDMQRPDPPGGQLTHRSTDVCSALQGIMRSVGVPPSAEALNQLRDARLRLTPEEIARRRAAASLQHETKLQRAAAAERRSDRDCKWL